MLLKLVKLVNVSKFKRYSNDPRSQNANVALLGFTSELWDQFRSFSLDKHTNPLVTQQFTTDVENRQERWSDLIIN